MRSSTLLQTSEPTYYDRLFSTVINTHWGPTTFSRLSNTWLFMYLASSLLDIKLVSLSTRRLKWI